MTRLLGCFASVLCLCSLLANSSANAQQTLILPGKWNVEQYRTNPNYLQVLIDMRGVHSKVRIQAIRGTATLYAPHNKFLRTAVLSIPPGELASGKVYVHYMPSGVSHAVKLYPISASANIAVYPPGVNPMPGQALQKETKFYPGVPLRFDKKLKITSVPAGQLKQLSARPASRR